MMSPVAMLSLSGSRTSLMLYPTSAENVSFCEGWNWKLPRSEVRFE